MRTPRKSYPSVFVLLAVVGTAGMSGTQARVARNLSELGVDTIGSPSAPMEERIRLEPILTALVQAHLAKEERLPGQQPIIHPRVWYNDEGNTLNVDLGREYVPDTYTISFEERLNAITSIVYEAAQPTRIYRLNVWFDGRDIFYYFPEEKGPADRGIADHKSASRAKRSLRTRVLVAAGHGVYYNSRFKDWRPQREPSNFVVEDFITPVFARHLTRHLQDRSDAEVFLARSTQIAIYPESAKPWLSMAARYHIKSELPDFTAIWNSAGREPSGAGLNERDQDIRSRPLYANHLGVDAVIHLHTNAHDDASVRGIRTFHYSNSSESKRLGDLALCYMKESLGSNSSYASFPVSNESRADNHGENRLANMPSIIAELGFHTNEDDAQAIRNDVFQSLTMRGLEKAYRMFREGHGCEHFSATYPDVSVVSESSVEASVTLGGFPRFPVRYASTIEECPSGIICRPVMGRFQNASQPLTVTHTCLAAEPFTIRWKVVFTDADGIQAQTTTSLHCQPKSG